MKLGIYLLASLLLISVSSAHAENICGHLSGVYAKTTDDLGLFLKSDDGSEYFLHTMNGVTIAGLAGAAFIQKSHICFIDVKNGDPLSGRPTKQFASLLLGEIAPK